MKALFYLTYALRALKRGGQRTLLAVVCVAFGVMSLVSMQLIADNFTSAVMTDPRAEIGGDFMLRRIGQNITAAQLDEIASLQARGVIGRYASLAEAGVQMMSVANGDVYLVNRTIGLDPAAYPLVGRVTMREPQGATLTDLLRDEEDAVVTRDLAGKLGLKVGDRFALSARTGSAPARFVIRGIVGATPEQRGDTVFYTMQAARKLAAWPDVVTSVSIVWPAGEIIETEAAQLEAWRSTGWSITTPEDVMNDSGRSQVASVFSFMFKGAGILGLVVGGIGVAATLRVLLARRLLEIAMLKTLGYRKWDLIALFAVETLILGATGGLIGALGAVTLSRQLTSLLARTGIMLFEYSANPTIIAGGVLIGIVTSVVFGLYPIVISSGVSPITLLRQLPDQPGQHRWRRRVGSLALFVVLAVMFTAVCSMIMGTVLEGAEIVAGGLTAMVILGALLGAVLSLMVSIPWPGSRMMTLARTNLKRQRAMLIFPLLALFAGVFAIGFASATMFSAHDRVTGHQLPDTGDNLLVYARLQDEKRTLDQAEMQGVTSIHVGYQLPIQVRDAEGVTIVGLDVIEGRSMADVSSSFALSGEPWSNAMQSIYVPYRLAPKLQVGQLITLVTASGVNRSVRVSGYYTLTRESALALVAGGVLASQRFVTELGGDAASLSVASIVDKDKLVSVTSAMRKALPQAIVVNIIDLNNLYNRTLDNLFVFVVAVATLALVAGAVLIANAVGLSMLQRQREMGILKAVGFSSQDVLKTVVLENGLLGFLSGVAGMAGVALAVAVVNVAQPAAHLTLPLLEVGVMVVVSVVISGGIALAAAWRPTRVRPMDVLRAE